MSKKRATADAPGGYRCPFCRSKTKVKFSRSKPPHLERHRVCLNPECGKRMTTVEKMIGTPDPAGYTDVQIASVLGVLMQRYAHPV